MQAHAVRAWSDAACLLEEFEPKAVIRAEPPKQEERLDDAYESGRAPFAREIINLNDARRTAMQDEGAPAMSIPQMAAFLRRKSGADLGARHVGSSKVRVCSIRDKDKWLKAGTEEIRRAFDPAADRQGRLSSCAE